MQLAREKARREGLGRQRGGHQRGIGDREARLGDQQRQPGGKQVVKKASRSSSVPVKDIYRREGIAFGV